MIFVYENLTKIFLEKQAEMLSSEQFRFGNIDRLRGIPPPPPL
jgi:hypothetical protein